MLIMSNKTSNGIIIYITVNIFYSLLFTAKTLLILMINVKTKIYNSDY